MPTKRTTKRNKIQEQAEFIFPPVPLNPFQKLMLKLDCLLTSKTPEQVAGQMHHKPTSPLEWFDRGREWYLSDGGYSRVWVDHEGHLNLGGNSLERVKDAWPNVTQTRAEIEALVQAALRDAGQQP